MIPAQENHPVPFLTVLLPPTLGWTHRPPPRGPLHLQNLPHQPSYLRQLASNPVLQSHPSGRETGIFTSLLPPKRLVRDPLRLLLFPQLVPSEDQHSWRPVHVYPAAGLTIPPVRLHFPSNRPLDHWGRPGRVVEFLVIFPYSSLPSRPRPPPEPLPP